MPDLLLELFSEEIPARMQAQASADLKRLVTEALLAEGLSFEGAGAFATPRRLTLHVAGLPPRQPDRVEEKRGPRVGAPDAAIRGFLKSAGLSTVEEARIEPDPKGKGAFYLARLQRPGSETIDVLARILPAVIRSFPWPKSMRWGEASRRSESLRWVRPLHAIVATFGPETEEPDVVRFGIDGVESGDVTYGHRFLAPQPIRVRRFDDYQQALTAAKVVLDPERRRDVIAHDARDLALAQSLTMVEDEGLLHEVAGLVEWPVVLMGAFNPTFLSIPDEAIRATIRANQKCFVLQDSEGRLAPRFILVSNIATPDDGRLIRQGNERVVRARLSDAKFFFETDLRTPLEQRLPKLDSIVFHEKLGTQGDRMRRLEALAGALAENLQRSLTVGAAEAVRAAKLAKADLVTEMVGEFPELQGVMGRYYALAHGEPASVADAIRDHYKPQGAGDDPPNKPESIVVALADKIDTLVGFWSIGEKPTGSKDPYALRRAALGVIRILLENAIGLRLLDVFDWAGQTRGERVPAELKSDLLAFFVDRLKVYLRDKGVRAEEIEAAVAASATDARPQDDMRLIAQRALALQNFLSSPDGASLLAGYRRASNIVAIEEKKDGASAFGGSFDSDQAERREEVDLHRTLDRCVLRLDSSLGHEDFMGAMRALAELRAPVDAFFEQVTVNASQPELRLNRLRLLNSLRAVMLCVADFSKIPG